MARKFGVLVLLALVAAAAALRAVEGWRADALLDGQARAVGMLRELQETCDAALRAGPHGLHRAAAATPGLRPLQASEAASYLTDDAYVYALASRTRRDAGSDRLLPGWILRAWPADFGATGNREYYLDDEGVLWEGQNRIGRSGTERGFPPSFPEAALGLPRSGWARAQLAPHR